jgi:hypothetical protein
LTDLRSNVIMSATKEKPTGEKEMREVKRISEYQGWNNYETWAVALYINDSAPTQSEWLAEAKRISTLPSVSSYWTDDQSARYTLADRLKEKFEIQLERQPVKNVWACLLRSAFDNVCWDEIAETLLNHVEEIKRLDEK